MNDRQRRFVEEFLVDLNATQAAIRAGYSEKTARQAGHENLTKPDIAEAIAAAQAERSRRTNVTADMVVTELARIGFSDIRRLVRWKSNVTELGEDPETGEPELRTFTQLALLDSDQLDPGTAAAIKEIAQSKDGAVKVKLYDKRAALVDLGRHLGLFRTVSDEKPGKKQLQAAAARETPPESDWGDDLDVPEMGRPN